MDLTSCTGLAALRAFMGGAIVVGGGGPARGHHRPPSAAFGVRPIHLGARATKRSPTCGGAGGRPAAWPSNIRRAGVGGLGVSAAFTQTVIRAEPIVGRLRLRDRTGAERGPECSPRRSHHGGPRAGSSAVPRTYRTRSRLPSEVRRNRPSPDGQRAPPDCPRETRALAGVVGRGGNGYRGRNS